MELAPYDKAAVIRTAKQLGVPAPTLAGLIHMESGFRPNVWGGDGGNYRGLIQFGPGARNEVNLPVRDMSIAEQMPYVKRYFDQRGFKPGMDAVQLYRTVLVGNPYQRDKDSWNTDSDITGAQMAPGGSLYKIGKQYLGDYSDSDSDSSLGFPMQGMKKANLSDLGIRPGDFLSQQMNQLSGGGGNMINLFSFTEGVKQNPEEEIAEGFVNSLINQAIRKRLQDESSTKSTYKSPIESFIKSVKMGAGGVGSGYANPLELLF